MKILVVVDMQNDFIYGPLSNDECIKIVPDVVNKIKSYKDEKIFYTLDTHPKNYLETQEGKNLPIEHCIEFSQGWMLIKEVDEALNRNNKNVIQIRKNTFGSTKLIEELQKLFKSNDVFEIEFIGVCTDICVVSNIMLVKAFFPEAIISLDSKCCAGVTVEKHLATLEVLKSCQVKVIE